MAKAKKRRTKKKAPKPQCGLCGNTENLAQTLCCGNWICDDADDYQLFSYARNSCFRNHDRYTLCGFHFNEGHNGDWKHCDKCREAFGTEQYVYFGTNEYNFTKLENPPEFEPTLCVKCQQRIHIGVDGYTISKDGYYCEACAARKRGR